MTLDDLFELECYLANDGLQYDHYNLKTLAPLKNLTGTTRYGVWDNYKIKGKWIIITFESAIKANTHFQILLERYATFPKIGDVIMITTEMGDYKILISVDDRQ